MKTLGVTIIVLATIFTSITVFAQAGMEYSMGLSLSGALAKKVGPKIEQKQDQAVRQIAFEVDPADKPAAPVRNPSAENSK